MNRIFLVIGLFFIPVFYGQAQYAPHPIKYEQNVDSVIFPASNRYAPASFFRKFFTGKNYRKEWTTPVKLPVFNLEATGLKIISMGGGMQTKSLRLVDNQGREWALRTVDKFAEGAVPPRLRNTLAEKVVQDLISASYPYAAITVGELAEALGIIAPKPVVYFVPDAEFMGPYRMDFGNTVCYLERREPEPGTKETDEFIVEYLEDNNEFVLQKEILKARLLDMLVADWDRHEGQWLWASMDSGNVEYYYPVPLDRDQAFFISDGLLARMAKFFALPHINGFKKKSRNLKNLSFKSWEFDRFFLNSLSSQEWTNEIMLLNNKLTDEVIDRAVEKLPPEIYAISGKELATILKSRRDGLLKNSMKYYRFLSARVNVAGSNEDEIFNIKSNGNGITVLIYSSDDGQPGYKIYERHFKSDETKSVVLYGLEGNDQFLIDSGVDDGIKLKFYGDKGKDLYKIDGNSKIRIYDLKSEDSLIKNLGTARMLVED